VQNVRDYLYLWHDQQTNRIVASGIEFRDLVPELATAGGVVLLRHEFCDPAYDSHSRFEFVPQDELELLAADDIYNYGDFCWVDFGRGVALAALTDEAIAGLAFFAQQARPLCDIKIPGLANRFLCFAHDDGWYASIFYRDWREVEGLLRRLLLRLLSEEQASRTLELLGRDQSAFWCRRDSVFECERSDDIDMLQSKYLGKRRARRLRGTP
jgi:hypothetical protein